MLQFNPDGTLKLTDAQAKQNDIERNSIVITREQLNVKPAIAQIRIKLPADMHPNEIVNFYHKIDDSQFRSVEHSIHQIDERTFLIKVDRGSMLMYGLLNFMIQCFKGRLSNNGCNDVIVKGTWANYGNA